MDKLKSQAETLKADIAGKVSQNSPEMAEIMNLRGLGSRVDAQLAENSKRVDAQSAENSKKVNVQLADINERVDTQFAEIYERIGGCMT